MTRKIKFLTTTIVAAAVSAAFVTSASATPYAFASNQITGLKVTNADGTSLSTTTATTSINDSAIFDGYPGQVFQSPTGVPVGAASTIPQAYSGPGPAPAAIYTPAGAGTFTGARSDAALGAGTAASGGVSVSNVAEAYGKGAGNSFGTNNASIAFNVTGAGQSAKISFSDLIQLIASTAANPGESATGTIGDTFTITQAGMTTPLASYTFPDIPTQAQSVQGVPSQSSIGPTSYAESFTTPTLLTNTMYSISLTSTAKATIQPGTPVSTPEPASLALVGAGLLAAGVMRRRRVG